MRTEITITGGSLRERRLAKAISQAVLMGLSRKPTFGFLGKKSVGLGVIIASGIRSQRLNYIHRKKNRPTNVLSFPVYPTTATLRRERGLVLELGDMVLCPSVIRREARLSRKSFYAQFSWCITHGILHIVGLDHERGVGERFKMERLEQRLLKGIPRA